MLSFSSKLACSFGFFVPRPVCVAMVGVVSRWAVAGSAFRAAAVGDTTRVAVLFPNGTGEVDDAFRSVYSHFADSFDHEMYASKVADFEAGLLRYNQSSVATAFAHGSSVPHCDLGVVRHAPSAVRGVAAFPGGAVGAVLGFDLGQKMFDLSSRVRGPASAGLVAPMALAAQSLGTGMGLVQSAVAALIHVVPPLVPPPAWNNQPLSCVPLAAGHNCFGSVTHPITMADFMMADVTDSMLDGYVAGFPGLYARKVGRTDDAMYKSCFSACSVFFRVPSLHHATEPR